MVDATRLHRLRSQFEYLAVSEGVGKREGNGGRDGGGMEKG